MLRHPLDGAAQLAADHLARSSVPVFNAGDGKNEHPTQTILDLFTIREHMGRLDDLDVGITGDLKYGRTSHSLVTALLKFDNVRIHLFSHPELALPATFLDRLTAAGTAVTHHDSMESISSAVDILYQTRIQQERLADPAEFERVKTTAKFTFEMLAGTRESFGIMHPLPMDKAWPSIDPRVDGDPKALYKRQAWSIHNSTNGWLASLIHGRKRVGETRREAYPSDRGARFRLGTVCRPVQLSWR